MDDQDAAGLRVLILTAAMGAGHTEVAAELRRRVECAGGVARVVDLVNDGGTTGARLRATYKMLLDHAPWVYGAAMAFWSRWPRPLEAVTAWQTRAFDRLISDSAREFVPDVVVSTYNLASQCSGRLLRRGRITAPVVTFVVDPGAHPYWVGQGVDLVLALTRTTAAGLKAFGARRVAVVDPVLRPQFDQPPVRADARAQLGLPAGARIVALNAGAWAAGEIDAMLAAVRRVPDVLPVVFCGRDTGLRSRLQRVSGVHALAWTHEVPGYLAAADVLVDNAGGQTCWEALACHTPVVLYRPLPGHGKLNAAALERSGLAVWARSRARLAREIQHPSRVPRAFRETDGSDDRGALAHILALGRAGR